MPVSLGDVQNSIKAGIQSLAAVVNAAVVWSDEPQPTAKTKLYLDMVYLDAIQDRSCVSVSELDPQEVEWALSTLYYIRVQVRAEAIFNAPGSDALVALEKVRAGLRRPDLVWAAGVVNQPDDQTFVHHVSFPHDGRTISAYSFETGFRAIVDFPLSGEFPPAPNMMKVVLEDTEVEIGEDDPQSFDQELDRPAP